MNCGVIAAARHPAESAATDRVRGEADLSSSDWPRATPMRSCSVRKASSDSEVTRTNDDGRIVGPDCVPCPAARSAMLTVAIKTAGSTKPSANLEAKQVKRYLVRKKLIWCRVSLVATPQRGA